MLCLLYAIQACFAQADSTHIYRVSDSARGWRQVSIAILAGYNYYGRSGGELGVTKKVVANTIDAFSGGINASCEFFQNKSWFIGPKIGVWGAGGVGMGCYFIYYTNFHQSSLQFRPAIGAGFDRVFFFYGRNMRITNTNFNNVSKNMVGINLFFDVKKYKRINFGRQSQYYH